MSQNMINARNLKKVYNKGTTTEVYAVNDISLEINKGEFISIMGASGSGKSTLMNILGCLDKPDSGTFTLDGEDITKMDDDQLAKIRNQKIGFVFQSFNLLPRTTALENVELPLLYSHSSNIDKKAMDALAEVGLKDRAHHHPNQLSGGQQQRAAIARALVNDPEIIFADEPTGNLDTVSSYEIMNIFQKLNKKGRTIVIITHESSIAQQTNRILEFSDGKIINDIKNEDPKDAQGELSKLKKGEKANEKA